MNRRSRSTTRSLKCPRPGTWSGDRLAYRRRVGLLVALSVSLHVCLATIGFFWVYRLVEGYLLVLGS